MSISSYRPCAAVAAASVFVILSFNPPVLAAAEPEPAVRQPEVVVTASRRAQSVDQVLSAVTVLTRADIEASQAPDLIDLLGRQAGIDISRTGGPGSVSTVFLRGANSNQTLILIDGVRVNATGQGLFDLAQLPPEQIERIEIVRGPRAALWGSDAIGGVIQIFTRDRRGPEAAVRAGRYGRAEAAAGFGLDGERGHLGLTAGYRRLEGFSATDPTAFGHDPDDDGYRQRHASLRGEAEFGGQTLDLAVFGSDADVEFDQGRSDAQNVSGGIGWSGTLGAGWQHRLGYGHARENLDTPAFGSRFESRRHNLDWIHTLDLAPLTLNLGLNWQREEGRSRSDFAGTVFDRSRHNRAAFLAASGEHGRFEWQAAGRYEDNSQFGDEFTGSLGAGVRLGSMAKLRLGWGEGFRAPNFNELYSPGFGGLFAGNPDLDPERSRNLEAGLDLRHGGHRLELSAFRNRVRDQIAFDGADFRAINIARARTRGLELEHHWRGGAFALTNTATWQDAEDRGSGRELLRRPDGKLASSLDWRSGGGLGLGLDLQWVGARRDFDRRLGGYALAHLRVDWQVAPAWKLEARLENLFDRDYTLASGFNTPGRSLLVGLRWEGAGAGSR